MSGLKRLVDLSASGIEQYLHKDVVLDSLKIIDNSGHQRTLSNILDPQ